MSLLLTIRQSPDKSRYEFLFRDLGRADSTLAVERTVLGSDRARLLETQQALQAALRDATFQPAAAQRARTLLDQLGDDISASLLPMAIQKTIEAMDTPHLIIETNELGLPWELARVSAVPLWERCVLGRRQIYTARRGGSLQPPARAADATRRVLIVADPEHGLPAAREEANRIAGACDSYGNWSTERLEGSEATAAAFLDRMTHGDYDMIHIACSAEQDPPCLFMADEPLPAARLADLTWSRAPRLVVLNACQAAAPGAADSGVSGTSAWARLFLDMGAEAVIGPLWDISDVTSATIFETFYRRLLGGQSVGEALRGARLEHREPPARDPHLTAEAYVLYGDPALSLTVMRPRQFSAATRPTDPWERQVRSHLLIFAGPLQGRRVPLLPQTRLEGRRITMGARGARVNDVELADQGLPNNAASLVFQNGDYHMLAEAAAVNVDGRDLTAAQGAHRLQDGATVRLGETGFVFIDGPPQESRGDVFFFVEVMSGVPEDRQIRRFLRDPFDIGRLETSALALHDPVVSRRHASIVQRDGAWALLRISQAPIAVNGVDLLEERRLQHGDEIQLSPSTTLRFVDVRLEVFN